VLLTVRPLVALVLLTYAADPPSVRLNGVAEPAGIRDVIRQQPYCRA
jgi:hypothetical protein